MAHYIFVHGDFTVHWDLPEPITIFHIVSFDSETMKCPEPYLYIK